MSEHYVTRAAWLEPAGRADAIDEIADQFERPVAGREAFWTADRTAGWPRPSAGWRAFEQRPISFLERRAG